MYYLLMLGRGHHAVDIPAELQSDLFYDSLAQKGSPQGALSHSNFSLLPDTEFKDECARLSAIDTSDWVRHTTTTRPQGSS